MPPLMPPDDAPAGPVRPAGFLLTGCVAQYASLGRATWASTE